MKRAFLILIFSLTAWADSQVVDTLLENEVQFTGSIPAQSGLITLVSVQDESGRLKQELMEGVVRAKLQSNSVLAKEWEATEFIRRFQNHSLASSDLFAQKLIVDIEAREGSQTLISLWLMDWAVTDGGTSARGRILWRRSQKVEGLSAPEEIVITTIQKELSELLRSNRFGKRTKLAPVSYSTTWHDPQANKSTLYLGISAGTPAYINLHIGLWGTESLPLFAEVSGMYFTKETRGFQVSTGWLVDNSGDLKQLVGIANVWFPQMDKQQNQQFDNTGRVMSTTTMAVYSLFPYVGPIYGIRWRQFNFEGGMGFRLDSRANEATRLYLRAGYVFPF